MTKSTATARHAADLMRADEIDEIIVSYLDHTTAPLKSARANVLAVLAGKSAPHVTSTARAACLSASASARTSHTSELDELRSLLPLTADELDYATSCVRGYRAPR